MMQENLQTFITDELIAHRTTFNRVNYIVDEFRGFIYDKEGNYLKGGKEVSDFITEQDKKLSAIDNRPRDYSEMYDDIALPF